MGEFHVEAACDAGAAAAEVAVDAEEAQSVGVVHEVESAHVDQDVFVEADGLQVFLRVELELGAPFEQENSA